MDKENISWKLIDKYFNDNPNCLVSHHLESFNEFVRNFSPKPAQLKSVVPINYSPQRGNSKPPLQIQ